MKLPVSLTSASLTKLLARFDALEQRERGAVALVVALVLVVTVQWLVVDPLNADRERLRRQITDIRGQIVTQQTELEAITQRHQQDPDRQEREILARLQQEEVQLDERLRTHMRGLVEPEQMAVVLEQVLSQKTPLRLHQVRSLNPEPLLTDLTAPVNDNGDTVPEQRPAEAGIFRHGLEIEFRGSYLATLDYLQALEALPWDFYWDGVRLEMDSYPEARVVITVHTLSLKEGWIGV
jgi:MSHA biogenesis protein MshJ